VIHWDLVNRTEIGTSRTTVKKGLDVPLFDSALCYGIIVRRYKAVKMALNGSFVKRLFSVVISPRAGNGDNRIKLLAVIPRSEFFSFSGVKGHA